MPRPRSSTRFVRTRALVPARAAKDLAKIAGMNVIGVSDLRSAVAAAFGGGGDDDRDLDDES